MLGDFFVNSGRLARFEMTQPFMDVALGLMLKYRHASTWETFTAFATPFSPGVWLLCLAAVVWTSVVMWFLEGGLVQAGKDEARRMWCG